MTPLRIRYSLVIIILSLTVIYFSGNVLLNKLRNGIRHDDFKTATQDESAKLSKNSNYSAAVDAFNKKDFGLAIDELNEEIKQYPKHAQAYFLLGKIYEDVEFPEGKYYSRMITNYEKYLELEPKGKRVQYVKLRVAQYYIKEGLTQQNIADINKAEEYLKAIDQNNSHVQMALGAIYLDQKNYDQAIAIFEKSANLPPSELKLKYNSLGLAYLKKKSYAKAQNFLEIAIKIDANDKYAHNNLGFVYAQQGNLTRAQEQFSQALKLDPSYKNAEKNLQWVKEVLTKQQSNLDH